MSKRKFTYQISDHLPLWIPRTRTGIRSPNGFANKEFTINMFTSLDAGDLGLMIAGVVCMGLCCLAHKKNQARVGHFIGSAGIILLLIGFHPLFAFLFDLNEPESKISGLAAGMAIVLFCLYYRVAPPMAKTMRNEVFRMGLLGIGGVVGL